MTSCRAVGRGSRTSQRSRECREDGLEDDDGLFVTGVVTASGLMPPVGLFTSLDVLRQGVQNVGWHQDALPCKATCHPRELGEDVVLVLTRFGKPSDYHIGARFVRPVQLGVVWILNWTHVDYGSLLAAFTLVCCCCRGEIG